MLVSVRRLQTMLDTFEPRQVIEFVIGIDGLSVPAKKIVEARNMLAQSWILVNVRVECATYTFHVSDVNQNQR